MAVKSQNERIIFGLKVRQFRQAKGLSFSELSRQTGISVSYLNEIEKGKKYPKARKVEALAQALGVEPEELCALRLGQKLAPVSELLNSNFLNELPLELFGIELSKIVEIIANAPTRVGAFISTLVELARNYALGEHHFYFGVLRSYLELHNNYFEDIEAAVDEFARKNKIPKASKVPVAYLKSILVRQYGYEVVENGLDGYEALKTLRALFIPSRKQLLLNGGLNDVQKAFQISKELGFNYLNLKERANTGSLMKVNSFEEVLSHFKANYFAAALLVNREAFLKDLEAFFQKDHWDGEILAQFMKKYQASPETIIQRMTNLLPRYFGIEKLFLLRFVHKQDEQAFHIDKELHLEGKHQPQSNGLNEHYCRRWLSISLLKDLLDMQGKGQYADTIVGAQISRFFDTDNEYFCISFARPAYPTPGESVSVTLGILVDDKLRARARFLDDPAIQRKVVNNTCERCPIQDCAERVVPPKVVELREKRREIQAVLNQLLKDGVPTS
ncbi:MAG: XRE family transcriptional regulator [Bacteroidetes bacterium]|nr:MAG: XRE family transcriptional regulator [Bacteroidota bacterium]